jgi:hypothetical protein
MNGPLVAAILTIAALAFVTWFAWLAIYEPSPAKGGLSFLVWALPLFYSGGWAAGHSIGETTGALILLVFFGFLGWMREKAMSSGAKIGAAIREECIKRAGETEESIAPD